VRIPFDRIEPGCIEPAIDALIVEAEAKVQAIVARDDAARTFDDTLRALDAVTERLEYASNLAAHLESVATTPELRRAYNAIEPRVSAFFSSLPLNEGLWKALSGYATKDDAAHLTGGHKRFLEKTMEEFLQHGAALDAPGKKRLAEIDLELATLTTRFRQNVLDATNAFEIVIENEAQLAGLPESARKAARQNARSKKLEGWRFTLHAPSLIAVMTYLDDRRVREQMYRAQCTLATRGEFDNRPLLTRILRLRREKATLLGRAHFADFALALRMAKTGQRARSFLERLWQRTLPFFERENRALNQFVQEHAATSATSPLPLQPWDLAYWAEKQRRHELDFDEEELRPFFPLPGVIEGLFRLAAILYGVRIVPDQDVPTWHPDVQTFRILDAETGAWLGSFYADLFPREDKRGGAWMNAFVTGHPKPDDTGFTPHVGLICANLTPPLGDQPALLVHADVETLFHEFGHLLHHCLTRVDLRSQAGTHVAWDFVELPSQIMENWCWERASLDLFARHFQSGEPIPEPLFSKLRRTRSFRSANAMMRQLGFATMDLALHIDFDPDSGQDVVAFAREILQRAAPAPLPAEHAMVASFTHLFADPVGYAAGYYSYKWAEVLEADAFGRFAAHGLFDRETGLSFRNLILARGDAEDPNVLIHAFLGREPTEEAMFARVDLLAEVDDSGATDQDNPN